MAIQIVRNLTATPNPTSLPKRIELSQTLIGTQAEEKITVAYALEPANDLLFKDGNAAPSKTFQRIESVGTTPAAMADRVVVQLRAGGKMPAAATIHQAITDSSGVTISDLVVLRFQI